jgi:DNA end-binding protein Ku
MGHQEPANRHASNQEREIFNQINKNTGNRIRYVKVDADSGDEVENDDIIKGYEVGGDRIAHRNLAALAFNSA